MKHDKIVSLAKSRLNKIEILFSEALIDSNFGHEEYFLINIMLKEYNKVKEEIKNLNSLSKILDYLKINVIMFQVLLFQV